MSCILHDEMLIMYGDTNPTYITLNNTKKIQSHYVTDQKMNPNNTIFLPVLTNIILTGGLNEHQSKKKLKRMACILDAEFRVQNFIYGCFICVKKSIHTI